MLEEIPAILTGILTTLSVLISIDLGKVNAGGNPSDIDWDSDNLVSSDQY
jgi:hypothetical protein